jgi:PAS domain S-box-containing protein
MAELEFQGLLDAASVRMKELHERAGSPPTHQRGLVPETFEELEIALEELQVASEELRLQNEALADSQSRILEEHHRYVELFNAAPDAYFVTDTRGIVRDANVAAEALLKVDRQFLQGKPLANFVSADDRERFRSCVNQLQTAMTTQRCELDALPRQGHVTPVEILASPVRGRSGGVESVRWLWRDVADRILAENERLLRVEEQAARNEADRRRAWIEHVVDDLSDPLFCLDSAFIVTCVNKRCQQMWGRVSNDVLQRRFLDSFPDCERGELWPQIAAAMQDGRNRRFEYVSEFTAQWTDISVCPSSDGVTVIFHEIQEQKDN